MTEVKIEITENGEKVTVRRGDYGVSAMVGSSDITAFRTGYFIALYTLKGKTPVYVIGDSKREVDRFERNNRDLLYTVIRELDRLTPGGLPSCWR